MEPGNGNHWQARFKLEEILEVSCPKCHAKPHEWCVRDGEKLGRRGKAMARAGTPPSHQERMWLRQGHAEHEFPALLAKQRPGCWDESVNKPGKRKARSKPVPRGGCTPCATERELRREMNLPGFPVDFPCRHPQGPFPVPPYPRRYTADRICPECARLVSVEVVVVDPGTIGYRCGRGHKWLSATRPNG